MLISLSQQDIDLAQGVKRLTSVGVFDKEGIPGEGEEDPLHAETRCNGLARGQLGWKTHLQHTSLHSPLMNNLTF
jgi:hypothetical protein